MHATDQSRLISRSVSRRRSFGMGLALAAMSGGLTGFAPGARAGLPPFPVVPARVVRNGWGICGWPGIDADFDAYAAMMGYLGTRDLRAPLVMGGRSNGERFDALRRALARAGLGSQLQVTALVGAYLNDPATTWQAQQAALLAFAASGLLRAIEGPNEINNRIGNGSHGPDDLVDRTDPDRVAQNFRAWAETLHGFRLRHSTILADVKLVAPSIASGLKSDYMRLPDVTGLVDAANFHFYAGAGRQPDFSMLPNPEIGSFGNVLAWARDAQQAGGPVWQTEAGAATSGNYARDGISQAKYLANQLFDFFAAGGTRMFFYQLLDGSGRDGDVEGNFGLFRHDRTPKPAAMMFARLKHLLSIDCYEDPRNEADTGPLAPGFDPRALSVVATAGTLPPRLLVMPKSDGSTMIAIWNELVIDDGSGHSLMPVPASVRIDFGAPVTFRVHDLMGRGAPPAPAFDIAPRVTLALSGYPLMIEISATAGGR